MRRVLTIGLMIVLGGTAAEAQDTADGSPLEARVWLDRGDQPVLQRGDRVRVYYRTSVDAPDCERPAEAPAETWRTWRLTRPSGFRTRSRTEPVCFPRDHRFGLRPPLTR